MRDITERKKAEEIQLESTRRFRQLFDEAPVGYYELDDQGRIIQVTLRSWKCSASGEMRC